MQQTEEVKVKEVSNVPSAVPNTPVPIPLDYRMNYDDR